MEFKQYSHYKRAISLFALSMLVVSTPHVSEAATWTKIADEWQSFTVSGTKTVRYGAGSKWVQKIVTGSGQCTNDFFKKDPAVGVVKQCQAQGVTAAPTVSLSASPSSVTSGSASTLTWSSTNATSCTASGGWSGTKAVSGTASTGNLTANATYTLTCKGTGGSGVASTSVTVTAPTPAPTPAPTVSLSASPTSVIAGSASTLTWSSTNATSCTASGGWSGTKAVSGTASTGNLTANATYGLTCTGTGGSASASATVTVTSAGTPTSGSASITPSLVPTRVSGTAPLAVLFDASATKTSNTETDTFRELTYAFNFGDDRGLKWAVSGKAKNTETGGPVAAHVFDLPGTYTVKLQVTDAKGTTSSTSVNITVADPATVYSGTNTVCISTTSDFTGCPSGAAKQATMPSGTQWNGKRFLFHSGQDFSSLGAISILDGNSNVQVGSFGTGAKPIVDSVGVGNWRPNTSAFATDIVVMDLDVVNSVAQCVGSRVLFYRNIVRGTTPTDVRIGFGGPDYWRDSDPYRYVPVSDLYNTREIFLVENESIGIDTAHGQYGVYSVGSSRSALLGNVFGKQTYHSVRLMQFDRGVIAHNELQGISSTGGFHSLKLHAGSLTAYDDSVSKYISSKIVVSNNLFGNAADNNAWQVAICPQNGQVQEGLENIMVENNRFVNTSNTYTNLIWGGRELTNRSNLQTSGGAITYGTGHDEALPAEWKGPYYNQ